MSFAEQLVNKINEFRTNPKGYAKKINEYVSCFKGKTLKLPGTNIGIKTQEGAAAYIEAVEFLSKQDGVEPFEPSLGLARISADFIAEAQEKDLDELGNIDLSEIIAKYGAFDGDLNRAIEFGGEDPESVLINLIVCDGDPSRGNRESLLSTSLKKIGVANAKHPTYRNFTIIITCTKFINTYDSNDDGFLKEEAEETSAPPKENIKETDEGKTIKPRKVILKEKPQEEEPPKVVVKETPYSSAPPKQVVRETDEGKTLKPRKVNLKEKPKVEETPEHADDIDDEEVPPEDVVAEKRSEKIIVEKGKKKRVIKICRTMADGSKETEIIKEAVEDEEN